MLTGLQRLWSVTDVGDGDEWIFLSEREHGFAGHTIVSFDSVLKGLGKLKLDETAIRADLNNHWEVTAEAIQTILRREAVRRGVVEEGG
jgi:adenylosuccinate lyase